MVDVMVLAAYEASSLRISGVLSTMGGSEEHEMEDGCQEIYRSAIYLQSGGFYRPLGRKIVCQVA